MKKSIGALVATIVTTGAFSASVVTAPEAHAGCDWRYNFWCVPSRPHFNTSAPRWPDPRPPLTSKNDSLCTQPFRIAGYNQAWYLINQQKVNKRMWPDYYHRTFAFVVYNGTGWMQPSSNQTNPNAYFSVDCDA